MIKIAISILVLFFGSVLQAADLPLYHCDKTCMQQKSPTEEDLIIRFIQVGSLLIKRGNAALLTDPFYSNPSFARVALKRPLETNTPLVDSILKPDYASINGILVGHGHYDHLLDAGYVMQQIPAASKIYGSQSVSSSLAPQVGEERRVNLEPIAAHGTRAGKWVYLANNNIRFMPIMSEHSPQFWKIKLYQGAYAQALTQAPQAGSDWLEGQTLAYIIDFLTPDKKIAYRIHLQTSASRAPLGLPPELPIDEQAPVDISIFTAASFQNSENYPIDLLNTLKPKHIIMIHWENFFKPFGSEPSLSFNLNITNLINLVDVAKPKNSDWFLPAQDSYFVFKTTPHSNIH